MTVLDEARHLLLSGDESWETLRAAGRVWEDRHAARAVRSSAGTPELPTRPSETWQASGDCAICEQAAGPHRTSRVRVRRSGTYVGLDSSVLPVDELLRVARSLGPLDSPRMG